MQKPALRATIVDAKGVAKVVVTASVSAKSNEATNETLEDAVLVVVAREVVGSVNVVRDIAIVQAVPYARVASVMGVGRRVGLVTSPLLD